MTIDHSFFSFRLHFFKLTCIFIILFFLPLLTQQSSRNFKVRSYDLKVVFSLWSLDIDHIVEQIDTYNQITKCSKTERILGFSEVTNYDLNVFFTEVWFVSPAAEDSQKEQAYLLLTVLYYRSEMLSCFYQCQLQMLANKLYLPWE